MAASNRAREPGRDQIALEKLPDHRAHPLVHHHLGHDEQRQRQQKLYVHLDVEQEGHADRIAPGASAQHRQHQQGQPGDEREEQDPATQELERIPGQVGPPHHLVQRPAQDHREVFAVLARPVASITAKVTSDWSFDRCARESGETRTGSRGFHSWATETVVHWRWISDGVCSSQQEGPYGNLGPCACSGGRRASDRNDALRCYARSSCAWRWWWRRRWWRRRRRRTQRRPGRKLARWRSGQRQLAPQRFFSPPRHVLRRDLARVVGRILELPVPVLPVPVLSVPVLLPVWVPADRGVRLWRGGHVHRGSVTGTGATANGVLVLLREPVRLLSLDRAVRSVDSGRPSSSALIAPDACGRRAESH